MDEPQEPAHKPPCCFECRTKTSRIRFQKGGPFSGVYLCSDCIEAVYEAVDIQKENDDDRV